jgi:hypothetical protein
MAPDQRIETYLTRLRARLRDVNDESAREIVDELRSHIVEKAAAGGAVTVASVETALAALGSPEELASEYLTDDLLARAEVSRSPVRILRSLFQWASLSVAGFFVLVGSIGGYFLGAAFVLCALLKPLTPRPPDSGLSQPRPATLSFLFASASRAPRSAQGSSWAFGSYRSVSSWGARSSWGRPAPRSGSWGDTDGRERPGSVPELTRLEVVS